MTKTFSKHKNNNKPKREIVSKHKKTPKVVNNTSNVKVNNTSSVGVNDTSSVGVNNTSSVEVNDTSSDKVNDTNNTLVVNNLSAVETLGIENIDDWLNSLNKKLLAIDFDQTLVSIHTGGNWPSDKSSQDLAVHVRPFFKVVIPKAIQLGIHIAIVTFSPQTHLIRNVLNDVFPHYVDKIIIRGNYGSWFVDDPTYEGKNDHIKSVARELERMNVYLSKEDVLLIDDDISNINAAKGIGIKYAWLCQQNQQLVTHLCEE